MANKFEFYTGNLVSSLEELLSKNFEYSNFKKTFLPQVFGKIRQFSDSTFDKDERYYFLEHCLKLVYDTELKSRDIEFGNIDDRSDALLQIKFTIKAQFSDIEVKEQKELTLHEKIILLEYLGILDYLTSLKLDQKKKSVLFSLLLDRHVDNVKKTISQVNGKPMKDGSVKNSISLKRVKEVADKLKIEQLTEKINNDYPQ